MSPRAQSERTRGSDASGGPTTRPVTYQLPMVPLRDFVVFPGMVTPLLIGRPQSVAAVQSALDHETGIVLAAQKEAGLDEPSPDDIYRVGTVAELLHISQASEDGIKVLVEGHERVSIENYLEREGYYEVSVRMVEEDAADDPETRAFMRTVVDQFEQYVRFSQRIPSEILVMASGIDDPSVLADTIAGHVALKTPDKQAVLETSSVRDRLEFLAGLLQSEVEILGLEQHIRNRVRDRMEQSQREYYLNEQLRAIREELGAKDEIAHEFEELAQTVRDARMSREATDKALKEIRRLERIPPMSPESGVILGYIDWLTALPWKRRTRDKLDADRVQRILDEDHYALDTVKERIVEYLAVRQLRGAAKGPILCLVGPPGVGKTSLGRSIARAMNRKFVRMSLGGVRDEAEIRGHRRTYVGAMPGRIIQMLRRAASRNPVFLLDEVDKMSVDFRGDPSAALLEVLDPAENRLFSDHYLEVEFSLEDVFFITTGNVVHNLPPALVDRMEVLELPGYTEYEKMQIALRFLVPKQMRECGLGDDRIEFSKPALQRIIRAYTHEAGVRNLEREIAAVCRKVARRVVSGRQKSLFKVTPRRLISLLGPERFRPFDTERDPQIGVAVGLAWTEAGGEVLSVETSLMPGKGDLTLTGQMGDVMQESARAGLTYIRAEARRLGVRSDFYRSRDIHIHVPEGSIPKDGPSAGVPMIVSMLSAVRRKPCRADVAMTGEITLRGRVLPVGGIKEKLLAAHRAGLREVFLPADNEKDLRDIPRQVMRTLHVRPVRRIEEVIEGAFAAQR